MKRRRIKTTGIVCSVCMIAGLISPYRTEALEEVSENEEVFEVLEGEDAEKTAQMEQRAILYQCDEYNLLDQPMSGVPLVTLYSGQQVFVKNQIQMEDGSVWDLVETSVHDVVYRGYIQQEYVIPADVIGSVAPVELEQGQVEFTNEDAGRFTSSDDFRIFVMEGNFEESIAGFPESYQVELRKLHTEHPNWVFVKQTTNIDWDTFILNEMKPSRSLVERNVPDAYKGRQSWAYDPINSDYIGLSGYNWVQASESAVRYYADPRNFLNDGGIFQFELLTYNSSYQTEEGVENILKNTFMSNVTIPEDEITYGQAFCKIGAQVNISPFMLAARVRQEQGISGGSPLISGTYPGYEHYFNYYNIQATGSTETEIYENGLQYAREQGWDTRYNSLIGGASVLSSKYISRGQDTLYLQKFDVDSSYDEVFWHQYMQNIRGAANEAAAVYQTYYDLGIINHTFIFKIPVYNNMPEEACEKPSGNSIQADGIQDFVERLYSTMLNRASDAEGRKHWFNKLASGDMSAGDVVKRFVLSEELKNQNIPDEEFVERMYRTMMNRNSDVSGKEHWMEVLDSGCSRTYVLSRFVASEEFRRICNSYGVERGSVVVTEGRDLNLGASKFVTRLYVAALGRTPEVDGLNHWAGMIARKETSPYAVAERIVLSKEFELHNYSDEEYVKILYRAFLGREAEEAGLEHWKTELANGRSRLNILQRFSNSEEFRSIVSSYGL